MIKKALFLSCVFLTFSSCYTIHFTKSSSIPLDYQFSKWHHITLSGLMEVSDPVNLKTICPNGWNAVRVRTGFLQGLVRWIAVPLGSHNVNLGSETISVPTSIPVGNFYSPEEVSISCKQ